MTSTFPYNSPGKKFRALFVDLDNTLYDFAHAQETACQAAAYKAGIPDSEALISSLLFSSHGPESLLAMKEFLLANDDYSEEEIDLIYEIYKKTRQSALVPYPGVISSLKSIQHNGIEMVAITNASAMGATDRICHIGAQEFFCHIVTPDVCGYKKPDIEVFFHAVELIGLSPHQICMVGDNLTNDIAPAKKIGICTVHARYGDRVPPEYSRGIRSDFSIDSFPEILRILGL